MLFLLLHVGEWGNHSCILHVSEMKLDVTKLLLKVGQLRFLLI